ncbi:hypothetical protein GGX14DRAFT_658010 [Mycena pura]|uniref:Transmembrane protein n=1 Tax=Mycena pura TaxID=153505 RepID=A0AAD7E175_9AGAR|nr:hypothetical protein GGX14DRAFT_658010 [Mycena pura]
MTDCTISRSLRLLWLLATAALAAARSVDKRGAQSEAVCSSDFNWADNSESLSPCTLTAFVWGACFTGNWDVPMLNSTNQYDNPNSTTANTCTCSWAAYNLISACTACQNFDASVQTWAAYQQDCSKYLTDTFFPSNVKLPAGTTFPFWAVTNPTSWMNARFNSAQAQALAKEGKPDLVPGQDSGGGKSKAPIGAIVGGVVGGVAVLAIGAAIVFWFIRKSKRQQNRSSTSGSARPYVSRPHVHGRSMSDLSSKSILSPQVLSVMHSQRPGTMYTTGTMHTHTGSVHSLSYTSGMSGPTPATSMLSPQVQITPGPEEIIDPFTLGQRPTSPPITMTRKGSETTLSTTYTTQEAAGSASASASASAAAGAAAAAALFMHTVPEDVEHHPPAYTPYASPSPSPEPASPPPSPPPARMGHHPRYEKGSVDTQASYDSTTSYGGPTRGDSISAVADVIQRMGLMSPPSPSVVDSSAGATTVATGESRNIGSRALKPNVTNPDS